MAARTDTRERILAAAARLFRRQGYEATGLKELVAEAGAPWGSLYHFFPGGKEQLGAEAVRRAGAGYEARIGDVIAGSGSGPAAAKRMFDVASRALERSDFADGCPIANVAVEAANSSETLRGACSDVFESWARVAAEQLEADGLGPAEARRAAAFVVAAFEGAITLARAHKSTEPIAATSAHVVASLEAMVALAKQPHQARGDGDVTAFIYNVTFDARRPRTLARFWSEVTGYVPTEEREDFVRLRAPDGRGVRHILFFRVDDPTPGKNRVHVDLATRHPESEIRRLLGLGASLVDDPDADGAPRWREGNGTRWVVLRDPEGNLFCLG